MCGPGACIQARDGTDKEASGRIETGNRRIPLYNDMSNAGATNKYVLAHA